MSKQTTYPIIIFPEGYEDRLEDEAPMRGYLSGVIVQVEEDLRYAVFFMDPVRLGQELDGNTKQGRAYFTEPGLVILPEVTTECIRKAVNGLWEEGFFEDLKPL